MCTSFVNVSQFEENHSNDNEKNHIYHIALAGVVTLIATDQCNNYTSNEILKFPSQGCALTAPGCLDVWPQATKTIFLVAWPGDVLMLVS